MPLKIPTTSTLLRLLVSLLSVPFIKCLTLHLPHQRFSQHRPSLYRKPFLAHHNFQLHSSPNENDDPFRGVPSPSPAAAPSSQPRLDPLFAAMTRTDPNADTSAPTQRVPLLGDVTLDRSLFLLLPLIGFAVGGVLLSIYVLVNSGDAMLSASSPPPPSVVEGGCRGLCSSQAQDLEGLRTFLNNFGK